MEEKQGRILLDSPADVDAGPIVDFLARLGHPVEVCHGPEYGTLCPILSGERCEKVEGAHGIVFNLDLDRPQHRAILARYQDTVDPIVPMRVVVRPGQERTYFELLRRLPVWTHEPTVAELDGFAAQVEAADWMQEASANREN